MAQYLQQCTGPRVVAASGERSNRRATAGRETRGRTMLSVALPVVFGIRARRDRWEPSGTPRLWCRVDKALPKVSEAVEEAGDAFPLSSKTGWNALLRPADSIPLAAVRYA